MPKIHPQKVEIRSKPYTLMTRRMKDFDGLCDHPATPHPEIWIHSNLKGEPMLNALLHECLHAAFPDVIEETIDIVGSDLAMILWELGYRNEDWD